MIAFTIDIEEYMLDICQKKAGKGISYVTWI